jgi:membrane protein DedA with SNARE-associated domain
MLSFLTTLILNAISSTGYTGIFILMTLESVFIPIPSEITMPFGGFLASQHSLTFLGVVLAGTIGNLIGSLIGYYIGYVLKEERVQKLIRKYGKYVLIEEKEYIQSARWFKKYGNSVVFFSRLMPAVRTFISLPAGILRMNIWRFSIYTLIGSFIWSYLLTYIGFYLGENWNALQPIFHKLHTVIVILIIIGVVYFLYKKRYLFKKRSI